MPGESLLEIHVHPLVLLNISDYYTRLHVRSDSQVPRIAGMCLGTQDGRQVSIEASFEILLKGADGAEDVDLSYLEAKLDQYKQVLPDLEVVGWFSVGDVPSRWETSVQTVLASRFDSPLLLLLNPLKLEDKDQNNAPDLPLRVFESQTGASQPIIDIDNAPHNAFVEVDWMLETSEAELIAVDHVSKAQTTFDEGDEFDRSDNSLIAHYTAQANAIKMLSSRVALLRNYVRDVKSGTLPGDPAILRQISALLHRLPVMDSPLFKQEFDQEQGNVLLTKHLSEILKGVRTMNDLIGMHALIAPKRGAISSGWM